MSDHKMLILHSCWFVFAANFGGTMHIVLSGLEVVSFKNTFQWHLFHRFVR